MRLAVAPNKADLDGLSDEELVEVARKGGDNAVRLLVKRNNRRLFRVARAVMRDDAEAEDIVQETYVSAFTKLDSFRGNSRFSTWLTRIALNEALGRVRKRRPSAELAELDICDGVNGGSVIMFPTSLKPPGADAELARKQVRNMLEKAVDDLPDPFRLVFTLRDIEEMSTEDTANQLMLKPETVKTRLHRARRLMRLAVEKHFSATFSELFPFDGARCERMADRVIERLRRQEGP
ncbi:MAG: RNA polymerase sigma factor [Mesorhizobium sp.]|uniref:RNA polymerase sigma factor n=1 Tax=Mesorhizobium sp. TaxID=1871066 RepID=UPI000FE4A412|nr:RNA polymerase sigma factor [Mesorhizobium sp.]RWM15117.1 MAG: RNA polymerase sigma factor [Mesorhizobium sp.]TIP75814.1 MAG: RNA polymerase sigma factor [Mesorhizobium sp.]TIQ12613.1 MAG: RNA polymerase sigma factor [Mesorhizobium sp.]TIR53675.1 MAG: RNA polymerase sigma factor [Mesorhizobium sp.]TJV95119.1 MAG: RNA polymerase sigma factor [Mesorhizobium sp.]